MYCNAAREGPSHGHGGHAPKIWRRSVTWFWRYARRETPTQIDWSLHSTPLLGQSNNMATATDSRLTSATTGDIHWCNKLPIVIFWVIAFDRRKPRLPVITTDDIQQPIDNCQTDADTTRSHWWHYCPCVQVWVISATTQHPELAEENTLCYNYSIFSSQSYFWSTYCPVCQYSATVGWATTSASSILKNWCNLFPKKYWKKTKGDQLIQVYLETASKTD